MNEFLRTSDLWLPGVTAMACLVIASGFFSASETALFYLSHDELRNFRVGKPRERMVAALLTDADRLLTAVLFWNLLINLTYFSIGLVVAQHLMSAGQGAAAGLIGVGSLVAIIVFGEVIPKSVAVVFRHHLATLVCWPLAVAVRLLDPVTPGLRSVTRVLRRTFWPHVVSEPIIDADDLERAVEASAPSREVVEEERRVLHNILDLSEIAVEEVMRPRGTYVARSLPVQVADLDGHVPPGNYLLVTEAASEEIVGAVALADFSQLPEGNLEEAAEEVVFVPWCASLSFVVARLRESFLSVACVVNEHGETIGIATYDDILETVLLPESSRAKRLLRREPILEVAPGRYHVEGITSLRYLSRRLDLNYEPAPDSQVTVSGLLAEQLEHLPELGEECRWEGCRIKVIDAAEKGTVRVMISKET